MTNFPYETFNELTDSFKKRLNAGEATEGGELHISQEEMDMYISYIKDPGSTVVPENPMYLGILLRVAQ